MRKALPLALITVVAAAGVATPALAAKPKPKPITESYAVTGAPVPLPLVGGTPVEDESSCMNPDLEGVSTTTRTIKPTGAGSLQVELTGFSGDWDITVMDGNGDVVTIGDGTTTGGGAPATAGVDTATATFKKASEIRIAVCNFAGSPSAKVRYTYTYK